MNALMKCLFISAFFFSLHFSGLYFCRNYLKAFGYQNKEKMIREGKETKSLGKERRGRKIINLACKKNIISI